MRGVGMPAALAVCAAMAALLTPPVASADTGGIGVRASAPGGSDPSTGGFLTEALDAGSTASGAITVSNSTTAMVPLSVYATNGQTAVTAGAVFGTGGVAPSGVGAWLEPAAASIQLGPGTQRTVGFIVRVPAGARAGDHVGAIVVQRAARSNAGSRVAVSQVVRGVVPIDVRVNGSATAQVRLSRLALSTLPGTQLPAVMVGIGDTGALMCLPSLSVTVTSSAGKSTTETRQLDLLLPGDTITYPLPWPTAPGQGTNRLDARATGCGNPSTLTASADPGSQPTTPGDPGRTGPSPSGTPRGGASTTSTPTIRRTGARVRTPRPAGRAHTRRRRHRRHAPAPSAPSRHGSGGQGPPGARPTARESNVLRVARVVVGATAFPLSMLIVLALFVLVHNEIDRRDPKLALAPAYSDPLLSFTTDPPVED